MGRVIFGFCCVLTIGLWLPIIYIRTKTSTFNDTYVKFYPNPVSSMGPYIGECLQKPEGWYCAQVRD